MAEPGSPVLPKPDLDQFLTHVTVPPSLGFAAVLLLKPLLRHQRVAFLILLVPRQ